MSDLWWPPIDDSDRLDKAKAILRAILDADDRGQGVGYSEAMEAAAKFLDDNR